MSFSATSLNSFNRQEFALINKQTICQAQVIDLGPNQVLIPYPLFVQVVCSPIQLNLIGYLKYKL